MKRFAVALTALMGMASLVERAEAGHKPIHIKTLTHAKVAAAVAPPLSDAVKSKLCADVKKFAHDTPAPTDAVAGAELRLLQKNYKLAISRKDHCPDQSADCIDELVNECDAGGDLKILNTAVGGGAPTDGGPAAGISWQASFVTGLASFLVERAGDELTQWLVMQFRDKICGDATVKDFFKYTCAAISGSSDQTVSSLLASAIRKDLERAPFVLVGEALGMSSDSIDALQSFFDQLRAGDPPLELLSGLADQLVTECAKSPTGAACVLAQVGLTVGGLAGIYLVVDNPATTLNSWPTMQQQTCTILTDVKDALNGHLPDGKTPLGRLLAGKNSDGTAYTCTTAEADKNDDQRLFEGFLRSAFVIAIDVRDWSKTPGSGIDRASQMLNLIVKLFHDGALLLGQEEASTIMTGISDGLTAAGEIYKGQYADGIRDLVAALDVIDSAKKFLPAVVRQYLPLVSDLASAKDPKDVQAALAAAAAPVGSWRVKRRQFHIGVTGVVGVNFGHETPLKPGTLSLDSGLAGGPIAALGIEISWPIPNSSSFGFYVTVLDVGQLAWVRLSSDGSSTNAASTSSDVGVLDVLSPGLYLKFGLGNSPFTLGVGASLAPALRRYFFNEAGTTTQTSDLFSMLRIGIFLAIDLELFPIY